MALIMWGLLGLFVTIHMVSAAFVGGAIQPIGLILLALAVVTIAGIYAGEKVTNWLTWGWIALTLGSAILGIADLFLKIDWIVDGPVAALVAVGTMTSVLLKGWLIEPPTE